MANVVLKSTLAIVTFLTYSRLHKKVQVTLFKKVFVHVSACPKRVICCDARQKDRILDLDNHSQTIFREIFT